MPRKIEGRAGIEVYATTGGQIAIKQEGEYGAEDDVVILDVNDVPTIVQWLQDVAADAAEIRRMNLEAVDDEQVPG